MIEQARVPVLTFLTNFLIGGTERQVLNLVRNHDRARYEVHLGCFRKAGPLLDEVQTADVALSEYPIRTLPSLRTLRQQVRFARYVRRQCIRVVHSFGFYANVFAIPAARLAGASVVVASIRDTGDHLTRLQRLMQKWVCRLADHILVNADAVRAVLIAQGYDSSRISVIHNGIDLDQFRQAGETSEARTTMTDSAPVVAVFARLNRLKGIEYFLEAAALVALRFETARFLIVGDSISQTYREELEGLARNLGLESKVTFTGFRSDVPALLSQVSVSVLPSLSEGLSNVVLEGMAAGVPVVATSVGGTPEMVDDGITGLLIPPRDVGSMADAIGSLLDDPARARSIGRAGRQKVIERFSLQATVFQTEQLYERLLRAKAPGRQKGVPGDAPASLTTTSRLPGEEWR